MEKGQIFELMNRNPAFSLATVDGNLPRVRNMLLYKADAEGIIFHSSIVKDLYKQITANPNVELCFRDDARNIQVRISGSLEIVDNNDLKDEISNHPSRAFLQGWRSSGSLQDFYDSFVVFRMKDGKAVVWTMETNFAPKKEIDLF